MAQTDPPTATAAIQGPQGKTAGVAIKIDGVSKFYETQTGEPIEAIRLIDLEIEPGGFISVVGPSGCGKSTLLMLIAGLLDTTGGQVLLNGAKVTAPPSEVGVVFQRDLLLDWRTVIDNVLLPIEIKRWNKSEFRPQAEDLLEKVGLGGFGRKYPSELSGGMRQRVAICRALIQQPGLLLMDEPFGALDALTREQMGFDVQNMWQEIRNTVLFITHSIDEAVFLADRVVVMSPRPGEVVRDLYIELERPRGTDTRSDPKFTEYTREIRHIFEQQGILSAH